MGHTAGNKNFQVLEHLEYFIKQELKQSSNEWNGNFRTI